MVAVADQQGVEVLLAAVRGDPPAPGRFALRVLDSGVEPDPLAQAEVIGVLPQELVDLAVVGEVRVAVVHREVGEADRVL